MEDYSEAAGSYESKADKMRRKKAERKEALEQERLEAEAYANYILEEAEHEDEDEEELERVRREQSELGHNFEEAEARIQAEDEAKRKAMKDRLDAKKTKGEKEAEMAAQLAADLESINDELAAEKEVKSEHEIEVMGQGLHTATYRIQDLPRTEYMTDQRMAKEYIPTWMIYPKGSQERKESKNALKAYKQAVADREMALKRQVIADAFEAERRHTELRPTFSGVFSSSHFNQHLSNAVSRH